MEKARLSWPRERPDTALTKLGLHMGKSATIILYAALMVAVIVALDIMFFRGRFWERLAVNIGIVLVFGAFYFRFFRGQ